MATLKFEYSVTCNLDIVLQTQFQHNVFRLSKYRHIGSQKIEYQIVLSEPPQEVPSYHEKSRLGEYDQNVGVSSPR